jgi:cellulose synthase/poly-beta-1,6-N-acetylglucosamine synthase-like glycosyltransferase
MKPMPNKLEVAMVIPTHNGSATIVPLLDSLVQQAMDAYCLTSITVACDGCTDDTAAVVCKFAAHHPVVTVIDDGQRLGKSGRLNSLFKEARADLVITMDDDLILNSKSTVAELVDCFRDERIGLAGGHDIPLPPGNFCQRILFCSDMLWHEIRHDIRQGDSVHNNPGRCMALRRDVYKHVHVPDTSGDDEYLYFRTRQLGYRFKFAKRAFCYYRLPGNFKDAFAQSRRHLLSKRDIFNSLGSEFQSAYRIPTLLKLKAIAKLLPRHRVFLLLALAFQISVRLFALVREWRPSEGIYDRIGAGARV